MIDRVNLLYTATEWGVDNHGRQLTNMGFMIKDIVIHTEPTRIKTGLHYNMQRTEQWAVSELLNVSMCFSRIMFNSLFIAIRRRGRLG